MKLILACLCGVALVSGCSTVPVQPIERVAGSCDNAQMQRIENARQPVLVARYWVHCPELPASAKPSS